MKTIGDILNQYPDAGKDSGEPLPQSRRLGSGNPDCPICNGIGFIRRDLPVEHPDFGKVQICTCRTAEVARMERASLVKASNIEPFRAMTFASFKTHGRLGLSPSQTKSLEYANNQSLLFSQTLKGWLLLQGGFGCGKTHLAAAIANELVNMGVEVVFLTVPDLLDWLRNSYDRREESFEQRFDDILNARCLVLDDLGAQNDTPWAIEKLYQLINYRYLRQFPTVLTTNVILASMDGRIASRLQDPDLVTRVVITAPDYRQPVNGSNDPEISSLNLLNDRSFANFSLRENEHLPVEAQRSLVLGFRAAQSFAEQPSGWLVLIGESGCGKTHLAAAVGNYRKASGDEPIFVVVPDLLDYLRATFSPTSQVSYDRRFEEVRSCPLLILDSLGTQSATPWASEKLFQLLNHRYNGRLPTVLTTSFRLSDLDPRILSRILDDTLCRICRIDAPAYHSLPQVDDKNVTSTTRTRKKSDKSWY